MIIDNCPCEKCPVLAMCISKKFISCEQLLKFLKKSNELTAPPSCLPHLEYIMVESGKSVVGWRKLVIG